MTRKRCFGNSGSSNNKDNERSKFLYRERELVTAQKLLDLKDDVLKTVLLFLDFRERSIVRGVCRHIKEIVDIMPPPDTTLEIRIVDDISSLFGLAFEWVATESLFKIRVESSMDISRLPPLRTIRPVMLHVESTLLDDAEGIDSALLVHLAEDIGRTVTDLSVIGLAADNLIELQEMFSKFDEIGSDLRKLQLSTMFPLSNALSTIPCLRHLESVTILLRSEMLPGWLDDASSLGLPLSALASLPNLWDLNIDFEDYDDMGGIGADDAAMISFAVGCSNIRQLKNLSSKVLVDNWETMGQKSIARMLSHLVNLEELSTLFYPSPALWREVLLMGGHQTLQKLAVYYDCQHAIEDVEAMVDACVQSFPSLVELDVHFNSITTFDAPVEALTRLKQHICLRHVNCGFQLVGGTLTESSFSSALKKLDQALGQQIAVKKIVHFDG